MFSEVPAVNWSSLMTEELAPCPPLLPSVVISIGSGISCVPVSTAFYLSAYNKNWVLLLLSVCHFTAVTRFSFCIYDVFLKMSWCHYHTLLLYNDGELPQKKPKYLDHPLVAGCSTCMSE